MKKIIITALGLFSLTACTDAAKEAETDKIQQSFKQIQTRLNEHKQYLNDQRDMHAKLGQILDPDGETVQMWNQAMANCENKDTEQCNELNEAMAGFRVAVSEHASSMLESMNAFDSANND
ncbi:hypothetical protein [Photobacterium lutimaris]|uniref:Lipoprotein n=1 Tax=Photobacterium lutimaris TaxID=388278 RepID=A0A2T3ITP3_9GAMM|nr:hypothetical protein [Photobacterium lutimaris]PSU31730.1 hypothetical protein C9I99_21325 [Photobacterium lutimaris]TDR72630.1 hypothetical protein DFP78_113106 [Photobacterium lutimaris]